MRFFTPPLRLRTEKVAREMAECSSVHPLRERQVKAISEQNELIVRNGFAGCLKRGQPLAHCLQILLAVVPNPGGLCIPGESAERNKIERKLVVRIQENSGDRVLESGSSSGVGPAEEAPSIVIVAFSTGWPSVVST